MAVHAEHARAERLEPFVQRFDVHDIAHLAVALEPVHVNVDEHVVEHVIGHGLERFPGLADLELAVRHEQNDPALFLVPFARQGRACRLADALAQRAGHGLHARRVLGADHLDRASVLIELEQAFFRHAAGLDQRCIQDQGVLGRREKEPVAVLARAVKGCAGKVMRIARAGHAGERFGHERRIDLPEVHHLDIERCQHVHVHGRGAVRRVLRKRMDMWVAWLTHAPAEQERIA